MNHTTLNFVVDTAAFVGFVLLTTTGVLMHYLLPPGPQIKDPEEHPVRCSLQVLRSPPNFKPNGEH